MTSTAVFFLVLLALIGAAFLGFLGWLCWRDIKTPPGPMHYLQRPKK